MEAYLQQFLVRGRDELGWSVHTLKGYKADLRNFYRWLAGEGVTEPRRITRALIQRYDAVQGLRDLKPESRRRKIAAIRAFAAWFVEQGLIEENPGQKIKLPPLGESQRTAPTLAEKDALLDGCRRLRSAEKGTLAAAVLACMFYAGLRPMEVVGLNYADIDAERRRLVIRHGKGDKRREVPINATLAQYLAPWLAERKTSLPNLFVTRPFIPLSYAILRELFIAIKVAAGLRSAKHLTAHCLRHWFATELHSRGTSVVVIQKLLGHANLGTTERYVHLSGDEMTTAVGELDGARKPHVQTPAHAPKKVVASGLRRGVVHRRGA